MRQSDVWESVRQEVGTLELLRSRTRTRRRRRKRSWGAPWTYLLPVILVYGPFWIGPVLFAIYLSSYKGNTPGPWQVCMSLHVATDAVNRQILGRS
jgi:ABC-type sugar transport system permease subunit